MTWSTSGYHVFDIYFFWGYDFGSFAIDSIACSVRDNARMHFIYGMCNGNARCAAEVYRQLHQYNRNRFPNHRVFVLVWKIQLLVYQLVPSDLKLMLMLECQLFKMIRRQVYSLRKLLPADYLKRIKFCRQLLRKYPEDPCFYNKNLQPDECHFKRTCIFNVHNLYSWSIDNLSII